MIEVEYNIDIAGRVIGPTGRWRLVKRNSGPVRMQIQIQWGYEDIKGTCWVDEDEITFLEIYEYGPEE